MGTLASLIEHRRARERAAAVAAEALARYGGLALAGEQRARIQHVIDGDCKQWPFREPRLFGAPPGFPKGYWVVYAEPQDLMLTSSTIAVVSKEDGRVVFVGSACDEG